MKENVSSLAHGVWNFMRLPAKLAEKYTDKLTSKRIYCDFFKKKVVKIRQQECIPVGCAPSAAVGVSPATHTPLATHANLCHTCPPPFTTYPPFAMHGPFATHTPFATFAHLHHACPLAMHAPPPPSPHMPSLWTE